MNSGRMALSAMCLLALNGCRHNAPPVFTGCHSSVRSPFGPLGTSSTRAATTSDSTLLRDEKGGLVILGRWSSDSVPGAPRFTVRLADVGPWSADSTGRLALDLEPGAHNLRIACFGCVALADTVSVRVGFRDTIRVSIQPIPSTETCGDSREAVVPSAPNKRLKLTARVD